ncbi:MAG: citrate synthase [Desulfomonilia bacterium]|jgi:citrate synthase|uniref:Citrate synthase n=1 Tax=anaerobic digester metagenome TaxID=1263854 RepID=A0A485M3H7_9ZZZZ|nr:citrate synthase [Deltaproteobacteria bacterium]HPD20522.1 citrate synthase [Deltaproteobacteria bacterium]HPX19457.1 citrate synthase [Deltaproteobacteria bacterium]HRS55453.1 citrate synthase [Desulfomonilia bacterium]HRV34661.1 citrate synthase [Desulfomonilia bacterium]
MKNILNKINALARYHNEVSPDLVRTKDIKLGLRNADGSGVVAGITSKGEVLGYERVPDERGSGYVVKPIHGRLLYCGYDAIELARMIQAEDRFGFEEVAYLLLTGELPNADDLDNFTKLLAKKRPLTRLERSILMQEAYNDNQMFALHSVISHLSRCDPNPVSTNISDVIETCISLIAKFSTVVAYNYRVSRYRNGSDLILLQPDPELSTAENFLYLIKGQRPSRKEALLFDLALMLHAEHGGGNNSTFAVRTVTSSGANTYMSICSGIASLSGHLHGGANEAVMMMMRDIRRNVKNWENRKEVRRYLIRILEGKAHDGAGKIYGMGHAVYTLSDPRCTILREKAEEFVTRKEQIQELKLMDLVAELASELIYERKGQIVSPNVDFYSGFVYKMLGIPIDLFTPIFAMARVVGWSAHRIEQIIQAKLIRPAYVTSLPGEYKYVPLSERKRALDREDVKASA